MSAVFRLPENDNTIEVSPAWVLLEQIEAVTVWLTDSANAASVRGAILDIGFHSRLNSDTVVVQGETIPLEFMRQLVELDVTLWLSLYPSSL